MTHIKKICKFLKKYIKSCIFVLQFTIYSFYVYIAKIKIRKLISVGDKIRIAFVGYASAPSVDALSDVCNEFEKDNRFECFAIIVPYTHDEKESMIAKYKIAYDYAASRCSNVLNGYDIELDKCVDYKNQFDLVFFEIEYDWIRPEFKTENFKKSITYFIPYGPFLANNMEYHFSHKMLSLVHKIFPTSQNEIPMLKKYSNVFGVNVCEQYLGYPKNDKFFRNNAIEDVWKKAKNGQKRIIWAPHHTWDNYSNFLLYYDFFLDYIQTNNDIHIVFKPHPALKDSLVKVNLWSEDQVESYYDKWKEAENGDIFEGDWYNLFLKSDAMIMDSISFMMEYSMTSKPSCVLYRENKDGKREVSFNECGEILYDHLYHAKNKFEIVNFMTMIKDNKDVLKAFRNEYVKNTFIPSNNELASYNIYKYILNELHI